MTREQALDAATALYPAEMAGLDHPWLNGLLWGGRNASSPDTAAKALADEGRIRDGYVDTLWEAIRADVETVQRAKARQLDQAYRETASALESGKRAIAERLAAIRAETAERTATGRLSVGSGLTPEARAQMEAVRKRLEGTDAWMKAPNGQPTRLPRRLWLLVRTPAFKAWFGDWENDPTNASKVVDTNGEPLVVYHGRFARFTVFDDRREGVKNSTAPYGTAWFASNRNTAAHAGAPGLDPLACFLNLRNPLVVDARGHDWDNLPEGESTDYLAQDAIDFYRDGLIVRNVVEGDGTLTDDYVVLTDKGGAANIKSATENTGAFSPATPDIRRSVTGEAPLPTGVPLVAMHFLPAKHLASALKHGGLPTPSIAVAREDADWNLPNGYGDCLLFFKKETVDPKADPRNVVFPGDAMTPRYPKNTIKKGSLDAALHELERMGWPNPTEAALRKEANFLVMNPGRNIVDEIETPMLFALWVRAVTGETLADPESVRAYAERLRDPETGAIDLTLTAKDQWDYTWEERFIDGVGRFVTFTSRAPASAKAAQEAFDAIPIKPLAWLNGSWKSSHDLDYPALIAFEDIEAARTAMTSATKGTPPDAKRKALDRLADAIAKPGVPHATSIRRLANDLAHRTALDDTLALFQTENKWYATTPEARDAFLDFVRLTRNIKKDYYEAKPRRIIGLGEIALAIVPQSNLALQEALSKRGIPFETYDAPSGIAIESTADIAKRAIAKTRFSVGGWLEQATEAHLTAEREGDVEAARRLVEEAAERAGYTIRATHGAPVFGFTVFDPNVSDDGRSLFFAGDVGTAGSYSGVGGIREIHTREGYHTLMQRILDASRYQGVVDAFEESDVAEAKYVSLDEDEAEDYGDEGYYELSFKADGEVIARVPLSVLARTTDWDFEDLSIGKILSSFPEEAAGNYAVALRMERPLVIDAQGNWWDNLRLLDEAEGDVGGNTREIAKYAKQHGYDGVIIQNVHDVGGKAPQLAPDLDTVYIVFAPRQIKSLDPFTYDGDGNLIPLAQRFDPRTPDIRRSVGGADPAATPARQKEAHGAYPDLGEEIATARFAVGAKRKAEYRALIAKARPNLPQGDVDAFMRELDTLDDTKKEKAALHWFVKGALILPEDRDKLDMATQMAGKYHLDFQAFDSPAALINRAEAKKKKPALAYLDPDTVPQLSNRRDLGHGVVIYDVEDSPAGQQAMRQIMNSHLGRNANGEFWSPWCLLTCSPTTGALSESARKYWAHYSEAGRAAAFHNGRLCAFQSSDTRDRQWWDLNDKSHGANIPLTYSVRARDAWQTDAVPEEATVIMHDEIDETNGSVVHSDPDEKAIIGDRKNGHYQEWRMMRGRSVLTYDGYFKNGKANGPSMQRDYAPISWDVEQRIVPLVVEFVGEPGLLTMHAEFKDGAMTKPARAMDEQGRLWKIYEPQDSAKTWRMADIVGHMTLIGVPRINGISLRVIDRRNDRCRFDFLTGMELGRGKYHEARHISEAYPDLAELFDFPPKGKKRKVWTAPRRSIIGAVGASNLHNAGYRLTEDARGRRILTKAPNATRTLLQGLNEAAEEVRNLVGTDFTRGERARATRLTHYSPTDRDNVALAGRWSRHQADRNNPTDAYVLASKHWGWSLGKDGKWRLEIPYGTLRKGARARLGNKAKENRDKERDAIPLGELINDEPLFAAYPGLANTPIYALKSPRGNTTQGYAGLGMIAIYPTKHKNNKELTDTLYHEIQHIIQEKENFEHGASDTTDWTAYANAIGEAEARVAGLHATQPQRVGLDLFFSTPSQMTQGNIKGKDGQWRRQTYDDLTFSHQRLAASQRDYLRDVRLFTKIANAKTLPALMSLVKTRLNIVDSEFTQQTEGDKLLSAYIEYMDGDTFVNTFADEASALRTLKRVFIHRIARQPRRAVGGSAPFNRADFIARATPIANDPGVREKDVRLFPIGDVPDILVRHGATPGGLIVFYGTLAKEARRHDLPPERLADAIAALSDPVAIIREWEDRARGRIGLSVLTDALADDGEGRKAPVRLMLVSRTDAAGMLLTSAYARKRDKEHNYVERIAEGGLLYVDEQRAAHLPMEAETVSSLETSNVRGDPLMDTVAYSAQEVKPQSRPAVGGADERLRAVNARVRTAALYYGRSPAEADIAQRAIVEVALFAEASRTGKTLKTDDVRRAYADFGIETDDRHAATIADRINEQARQERYTPRKKGNASTTPRDVILQQQERLRQAYDIHWTQAQKDAFAQGVAGAFGASRDLARDAMEVAKAKRDEAEAIAQAATNSSPCSPTTAPSPSTKTRPKPSSASPSTTATPESSTMRLRGWGERRSGGLGGETLRGLTRNP